MNTVQYTVLEEITCGTCGIPYAVPSEWIKNRRNNGGDIHCPNGCIRTWRETEAVRLRKQLEAKDRELTAAKCEITMERDKRALAESMADKVERKLKRVDHGVCPCCNRTFNNLARHMAVKHRGQKFVKPVARRKVQP